jgi:hypothetical protein
MLAHSQNGTRFNSPEGHYLHSLHCGNLKSHSWLEVYKAVYLLVSLKVSQNVVQKIVYPEYPGPDQLQISDFPDFRYPNSKIAQWSEKRKKWQNRIMQ